MDPTLTRDESGLLIEHRDAMEFVREKILAAFEQRKTPEQIRDANMIALRFVDDALKRLQDEGLITVDGVEARYTWDEELGVSRLHSISGRVLVDMRWYITKFIELDLPIATDV